MPSSIYPPVHFSWAVRQARIASAPCIGYGWMSFSSRPARSPMPSMHGFCLTQVLPRRPSGTIPSSTIPSSRWWGCHGLKPWRIANGWRRRVGAVISFRPRRNGSGQPGEALRAACIHGGMRRRSRFRITSRAGSPGRSASVNTSPTHSGFLTCAITCTSGAATGTTLAITRTHLGKIRADQRAVRGRLRAEARGDTTSRSRDAVRGPVFRRNFSMRIMGLEWRRKGVNTPRFLNTHP